MSRSSKIDCRLRRLEKTVESQSLDPIVALTQLKSGDEYAEQRRPDSSPDPLPSAPRPRESHSHAVNDETETVPTGDVVDADANCHNLSSAVAKMGLSENGRDPYSCLLFWITDHEYARSRTDPYSSVLHALLEADSCPSCPRLHAARKGLRSVIETLISISPELVSPFSLSMSQLTSSYPLLWWAKRFRLESVRKTRTRAPFATR